MTDLDGFERCIVERVLARPRNRRGLRYSRLLTESFMPINPRAKDLKGITIGLEANFET